MDIRKDSSFFPLSKKEIQSPFSDFGLYHSQISLTASAEYPDFRSRALREPPTPSLNFQIPPINRENMRKVFESAHNDPPSSSLQYSILCLNILAFVTVPIQPQQTT